VSDTPDEEPLEAWAARRDARLRPVGELRAFPLAEGPYRAEHDYPDRPRLIAAWDGTAWTPVAFAENRQEACRILADAVTDSNDAPEPAAGSDAETGGEARPLAMAPGRGRHRKPRPGERAR
jgi:hypothetical protein